MSTAPVLVADIGGTNARLALTHPDTPRPGITCLRTLACADHPSLQHAIEAYLAGIGIQPQAAVLAVACPVDGEAIRLTNHAWAFQRGELQAALGLRQLSVINDFGAIARAVPWLAATDRVTLQGEPDTPLLGPVSVLGPGTGLGVALLLGDPDIGWQVVETEGGHAGFAPIGDEEQAIARHLAAVHGRASNERVLSGAGLARIDALLRAGESGLPPADREPAAVLAAALDGHDLPARQALERFCAVLGSVAGDIALVHGARTVVLAGGIVPRFIPFLRTSAFRERFLAKGRFAHWLEKIALHVITHPQPGLLGAAVAARELPAKPRS